MKTLRRMLLLLGGVIKCEDAATLNHHRTAITKSVMLYRNFVARRLNPRRYENPYIGRRSMEILLERKRTERQESIAELAEIEKSLKDYSRASNLPVMNSYEAEEHKNDVEAGRRLPDVKRRLEELQRRIDEIDLMYIIRVEKEIREQRENIGKVQEENLKLHKEQVREEEQKSVIETDKLPLARREEETLSEKIRESYNADWIRDIGEPRFAKERTQGARTVMTLRESFVSSGALTKNAMDRNLSNRRSLRAAYNRDYIMPFDIEREDNEEYSRELHVLADIRLPDYVEKIRDSKEKAYSQFRDDFIAKLKSNIETVREQINELNDSLKHSTFGTDRYRFVITPRAEYERNIRRFTDYKTYLVFDLLVTNSEGEEQRLSRTLLKKSGGETQIPFYISLLASFSQVCRIRSRGKDNTLRLIILDEAFSKMDGERIRESIPLLRRFGLQAVFSAPPGKIGDIAPLADRNIVVYRKGRKSFTRHFDPARIEAENASEEN